MLLKRTITGIILALAALAVVHYVHFATFLLLLLLLTVGLSWEWANLAPFKVTREKLLYVMLVLLTTMFLLYNIPAKLSLVLITVFWVGSIAFLFRYPNLPEHWYDTWLRGFLGILILSTFVVGLIIIKGMSGYGRHWLLMLLLLVWAADTGAYIVGRCCGKTKLAPDLSPGKTWEGVVGGLILSYIVAIGFAYYRTAGGLAAWDLCALVVVVNVFAVVGDLFISLLKRQVDRKDTGRLLPGHGGLLDRLDGFIAVTPAFALWLLCYVR